MPVYLDHNATTPPDGRVIDAMLPYLREQYGNPSSVHRVGRAARSAIEVAREQVAELVGAQASQVVFTSGGTEANNLAIKGVAGVGPAGRLLIGATEHLSVASSAKALTARGWTVDEIPVDEEGRVKLNALEGLLAQRPTMVSVMAANNETGVVQDVGAVAARVQAAGAWLHTDAVQVAGKLPVDFTRWGAQLMSLSAHKINGPKGVGALILDKSVEIEPLLHGGGQEKSQRSGTENVAGIVGFGVSATLAKERLAHYGAAMGQLQARLESGLRAIGGIEIFSARAARLPNTVCFGVRDVDGETLLMSLDRVGMAVSSGSACSSGRTEPNPILLAMGVDPDLARGSIRVSLGVGNSERDVDEFVAALATVLNRLRPAARRIAG
jgi:cysteine desulfurase